jgi:hypothetical protein
MDFPPVFGVIKNKLDLLEVTKMNYYPNKNRLELIFTDESYFYIPDDLLTKL